MIKTILSIALIVVLLMIIMISVVLMVQLIDIACDVIFGVSLKEFLKKGGKNMKAFEPYIDYKFIYPEDMDRIIEFLESRGKLNISYIRLEELYGQFSDECYCAGWMRLDNDLLERFANWLSKEEV